MSRLPRNRKDLIEAYFHSRIMEKTLTGKLFLNVLTPTQYKPSDEITLDVNPRDSDLKSFSLFVDQCNAFISDTVLKFTQKHPRFSIFWSEWNFELRLDGKRVAKHYSHYVEDEHMWVLEREDGSKCQQYNSYSYLIRFLTQLALDLDRKEDFLKVVPEKKEFLKVNQVSVEPICGELSSIVDEIKTKGLTPQQLKDQLQAIINTL